MEPEINNESNTKEMEIAKGVYFGALIGDSLGSKLEFKYNVTTQEVEEAWEMPGGGCHGVGPGQITDDGELAICLGAGIINGKGIYNLDEIAIQYGKWFQSPPFDIGNTCRQSVGRAIGAEHSQAILLRKAAIKSMQSQANGSLMRIAPLAIFLHKLSDDEIFQGVAEDSLLTHPNPNVIACNACYAIAIAHLFKNPGDNIGAYEKAKNYAKKNFESSLAMEIFNSFAQPDKIELDIISKGGDTDTNACIVGGMIGALHGISGIPEEKVNKILSWTPQKGGINRPHFLIPKFQVLKQIEDLISLSPSKLEMKSTSLKTENIVENKSNSLID